ncbi:MAG TPA: hypothetical protein VFN25_04890 [Dokdonella sp.]|uniref:hypothetical protein n=1 Tax=Dokdonella sp. TaxID=2291710 RepID=UPI002D804DB7|nr:hypothetical protein [Dokdonella sp.]HET9032224.1 hypothetical protein [Dokdonella sp.]
MSSNDKTMSEGEERSRDPVRTQRISFESLRERTDELELLISGISLLALISLPSWLFDRWASMGLHLEGGRLEIVSLAFQLAIGLSYTLAAAFLLHLAVRAYWVGLIGLKAVFPGGIRWDHLRNLGPLTREHYQQRIVDLESSINAVDRVASVIFAMISLITLSVIWVGVLLVGLIVLAMLIGYGLGLAEATVRKIIEFLSAALIVTPLVTLLLDRGSAKLRPIDASPAPWFRRMVLSLLSFQAVFMPIRLMMPVHLSLESNLPRKTFSLAFGLVLFSTVIVGMIQPRLVREFAPFGSYAFMPDADIDSGMRSASYENQRGAEDRLLYVPMIPGDLVADSRLRLFLPYIPNFDNGPIRERCADASSTMSRHACLISLWSITLDGQPVEVDDFVAAEHRDLGMRGLQGYLAMNALVPGQHELVVTWNPAASAGDASRTYRIPFWFAPPYQLDLAPANAAEALP